MKRIISLTAAAALILTVFFGCAKQTVKVMWIVDKDAGAVMSDEFMDYYNQIGANVAGGNLKDSLDQEINGLTVREYVRQGAVSQLLYAAGVSLFCDEYGISEEEIKAAYDEKYAGYVEHFGGERALKNNIKDVGSTYETYLKMVETEAKADLLKQRLYDEAGYDEEQLKFQLALNFFNFKTISVAKEDGGAEAYNMIKERLSAGESFETLLQEYGGDPGADGDLEATFNFDTADPAKRQASILDYDAIGYVEDADDYYYIVKRYDTSTDEAYEKFADQVVESLSQRALDEKTENLSEQIAYYVYADEMEEAIDSYFGLNG